MRYALLFLSIVSCTNTRTSTPSHPPITKEPEARIEIPTAGSEDDQQEDRVLFWDTIAGSDLAPDNLPPPANICSLGDRQECGLPDGFAGVCNAGIQICNLDSWSQCSPSVFPVEETCDGLDNDCDGEVDESRDPTSSGPLSRACYTGPERTAKFGGCRLGTSVCHILVGGSYGYGLCVGEVLPSEEVCNGVDDDCDGEVDDFAEIGSSCSSSEPSNLVGECRPGSLQCAAGSEVPQCVDEVLPSMELCDELDNDCDGEFDEHLGTCDCDNPFYVPRPEICNGIDDDCDGLVDNEDGLNVRLSSLCYTNADNDVVAVASPEEFPTLFSPCVGGRSLCSLGADGEYGYFECQGEVRPGRELCDGLDNDCDGNVDESFEVGTVAVVFGIDISGSMRNEEIETAVTVANTAIQRLVAESDICYIVTVVGKARHPILVSPALGCVPGGGNNGVNAQAALNAVSGERSNSFDNEGTIDLIFNVAIDDRDVDGDGVAENVTWRSDASNLDRGHVDIDFSDIDHRFVIIIGDERAQTNLDIDTGATAIQVHASGTTVYVVSPLDNLEQDAPPIIASYSQLFPQRGNDCIRSPETNWCANFYPIDRSAERDEQVRALSNSMEEVLSDLDCVLRGGAE